MTLAKVKTKIVFLLLLVNIILHAENNELKKIGKFYVDKSYECKRKNISNSMYIFVDNEVKIGVSLFGHEPEQYEYLSVIGSYVWFAPKKWNQFNQILIGLSYDKLNVVEKYGNTRSSAPIKCKVMTKPFTPIVVATETKNEDVPDDNLSILHKSKSTYVCMKRTIGSEKINNISSVSFMNGKRVLVNDIISKEYQFDHLTNDGQAYYKGQYDGALIFHPVDPDSFFIGTSIGGDLIFNCTKEKSE